MHFLVRSFAEQHRGDGFDDDQDVGQQALAGNILEVEADLVLERNVAAALNLPEAVRPGLTWRRLRSSSV